MKHMLADHLKSCATSDVGILHFGADSPTGAEILYRSDTLCVRSWPGQDISRWFITFDHIRHDRSLDRAGFAEEYFRSRGISVVTVVGSGNDWYQYPDMELALHVIRRALEPARSRITYGSSMGAYAAIRFVDALGATACLALSPQYSNDPGKVPFERRWRTLGRSIRWRKELERPIRCTIRPIVIYDSRDDDAKHAALIATDTRLSPIAIPYAGHPTSTYLNAIGLLDLIIETLLEGDLDLHGTARIARDRRKSAPVWIGLLAQRQPAHRPRTAEWLARDAVSRAPDCDLLLHILAQILMRKGAHGDALLLHRRAYELSDRLLEYGLSYSRALQLAGLPRKSLETALELQNRFPDNESLSDWIARLHALMGNLDRAIQTAAASLEISPGDDRYASALAHYRTLLSRRQRERRPIRRIGRCLGRAWKIMRTFR